MDEELELENVEVVAIIKKNYDNYVYDEVKGSHGKKSAMSVLNKRLVGKHEMDELFCDWD